MECKYIIEADGKKIEFKDKASLVKYIRDNQLFEVLSKKDNPEMTTESLADVLRQIKFGEQVYNVAKLRSFQEALLSKFIDVEKQSQYFYKVGGAVSLTKGLGKSFDQMDNLKKNLSDLGLSEYGGGLSEDVPFDVRYAITGNKDYKPENSTPYYHKITANNLRIMNEIDSLSRTMFMERTPSFINVSDRVVANLKYNVNIDNVREMKDELLAFSQIAAYKQWISINDKKTSTLRNSLIYDTDSNLPNIIDIAKEAIDTAPNNTFLQFILPVSTSVKVGKKVQRNVLNRDLINTIEGKTRGKLEPDMITTLMDSFTELYQNPKTQFHAKALFDYLIVKDGLMFKNKSFIRMIPTLMFNDISKATEIASKLMSANSSQEFKKLLKELDALDIVDKEGNFVRYFTDAEKKEYNRLFKENDLTGVKDLMYKKIFGLSFDDLYDRFENIYGTDVNKQFNLELVRPTVMSPKGRKIAESISFHKGEDKKNYLHINLFPDKYKALPKNSEERKTLMRQLISESEEAGFFISPFSKTDEEKPENNRLYLEFKKFIRVRGRGSYQTYKLVSVRRDNQDYLSKGLTPKGELVPRGTTAVYEPITPVGTSNSLGVADLGRRPSSSELQQAIDRKLKRNTEEKPIELPTIEEVQAELNKKAGEPKNTDTPNTEAGTAIGGGIFGGLQQLPYDEGNDIPLDFFSDEQIEDDPC